MNLPESIGFGTIDADLVFTSKHTAFHGEGLKDKIYTDATNDL